LNKEPKKYQTLKYKSKNYSFILIHHKDVILLNMWYKKNIYAYDYYFVLVRLNGKGFLLVVYFNFIYS